MKQLLSKINTTTTRSIIAGLALAMTFVAGTSLAQQFIIPSPVPLTQWIGQDEDIVDRNGSLTIGDIVTPAWMKNPDADGFPDCILDENSDAIRTESCLDVSGGASFGNVLIKRAAYLTGITAIGGTSSLFPSAGDARFIVQDIAGIRDSILVTGLGYRDSSDIFAPRNLTTQRAVCARQDGVLFACTQGEVIDNPISYDWSIGEWSACSSGGSIAASTKTRTVTCQDSEGNNHPDSVCIDNGAGPKPPTTSTDGCTVSAQCGSANNQNYSSAPTSGLCASGTASTVNDSGPFSPPRYRWNCTSGSDSVACSAGYTAPPVNGACGSANNGTTATAPNSNLCSNGSASAVSDNTSSNSTADYTWTCSGLNGGSNVSCSSNQNEYTWTIGSWGECSGGSQSRIITCRDGDGNLSPNSLCPDPEPDVSRSCVIQTGQGNGGSNGSCGFSCTSDSQCQSGIFCYQGFCDMYDTNNNGQPDDFDGIC